MRVARDAPCTVILVKQALPFEQLAQPLTDADFAFRHPVPFGLSLSKPATSGSASGVVGVQVPIPDPVAQAAFA